MKYPHLIRFVLAPLLTATLLCTFSIAQTNTQTATSRQGTTIKTIAPTKKIKLTSKHKAKKSPAKKTPVKKGAKSKSIVTKTTNASSKEIIVLTTPKSSEQPIVFTGISAMSDLFLLRGMIDFEIGTFNRIFARVKIPKGTTISDKTDWSLTLGYPNAKTGEINQIQSGKKPVWVSPDGRVAEFLLFSTSGSEEYLAPATFISDIIDGPYSREKSRVSLSATLDKAPKPIAEAAFYILKPAGKQSNIITSDDEKLRMELPLDTPWQLQSKSPDKIVLGYGGLYEEYPPTFTIYVSSVEFSADPRAAEIEFVRNLEDQKRAELGPDYFPISKANVIANSNPLQFKFNFAIDDPQTGQKRNDYRNWKGYVIYKDGVVYCLIGETYDMLKYEDQFDALAALVKIK